MSLHTIYMGGHKQCDVHIEHNVPHSYVVFTHSRSCKMSLQVTLVAMTGLDTMLLNSVATVEGSTLVTYTLKQTLLDI